MMEKQLIPAGYKQTEVGVIPEDWDVEQLESLVAFNNGAAHENDINEFGKYVVVNSKFISTEGRVAKYSDKCLSATKTGNILMVMSDVPNGKAIAKCFSVDNDDKYTVNQRICSIEPKTIESKFLFYILNRNKYYLQFDDGAKQTNLRRQDVLSCPVLVPPPQEQTAIANALSDVDALIAALEKLINKKSAIKTAAMQQLLTGKKRLPPFDQLNTGYKHTELGEIPGDWGAQPLSELTTLMTNGFVGTAKTHYTDSNDGVLYIQGYNVEENGFNFHGIKRVTQEFHQRQSKSCLREGDVLMVQTGDVGLTTVVPIELAGSNCHALIISRFKAQLFNSLYFSYFLNSADGRNKLKDLEVGTTMKHINVGDLLNFLVPVPSSPEEQTAIANVLSDMDKDLETLQQRLHKTQQIKQGMMQELLTGKTRLI